MYELDLLCFTEPFRFDLRAMRRYTTQPGAIVILAEASSRLIGFILVETIRRSRTAYVTTLDVHPSARRQGIARTLVSSAEQQAGASGATSIHLHVHTDNDAALNFYESLGYVRQDHQRNFYAPNVDAWTYSKALLPAKPPV